MSEFRALTCANVAALAESKALGRKGSTYRGAMSGFKPAYDAVLVSTVDVVNAH